MKQNRNSDNLVRITYKLGPDLAAFAYQDDDGDDYLVLSSPASDIDAGILAHFAEKQGLKGLMLEVFVTQAVDSLNEALMIQKLTQAKQ